MTAQTAVSFPLTAVRVGRTDVGAGLAAADDDAVVITFAADADRRLRLRYDAIDGVHRGAHDVEITMRDGTRVIVSSPDAQTLHDTLLGHCRTLPELTRTLRAFGSSRGSRGLRGTAVGDQQRFFAPLIDARRSALDSTPSVAIGAFNGAALLAALDATLHQFAVARYGETGPATRALRAELEDVAEPMFDSLRALAAAGESAAADPDDLRAWRDWARQLRATFETADRVWVALDAALDAAIGGPLIKP